MRHSVSIERLPQLGLLTLQFVDRLNDPLEHDLTLDIAFRQQLVRTLSGVDRGILVCLSLITSGHLDDGARPRSAR